MEVEGTSLEVTLETGGEAETKVVDGKTRTKTEGTGLNGQEIDRDVRYQGSLDSRRVHSTEMWDSIHGSLEQLITRGGWTWGNVSGMSIQYRSITD